MKQITRVLAPASLAITCCRKVQVQTIFHRHFNIARSTFLLPKLPFKSCQKLFYMDKEDYKLLPQFSNDASVTVKEGIDYDFKKLYVSDNSDKNVCNVDGSANADCRSLTKNFSTDINKYKDIRKWEKINKENAVHLKDSFVLKLLSFNILAQGLLESHAYLYQEHHRQALPWEKRKPLLVQEILGSEADVICLQEVQEDHLRELLNPFQEHGFTYLYKKRTNDKKDGLLLLYKEDLFNLLEFSKVELYQTGIELLSRDNVGLVAKFSLKESPETKFVISTTHLLFNPRRNDVRLGQIQLLFAEIERIAFIENTPIGPSYLPIVLAGDFNLEPYSGVYNFITEGSIEFAGKGRNLEKSDYRRLSNSLIPPHLYVTDECQHFNVLSQRLSGKGSGKVMLENTENQCTYEEGNSADDLEETKVDSKTDAYQKVEIANGHYVTFSSGLLTHPFQFQSVYKHTDSKGRSEATTFQNKWITVDYIFYSKLIPLEKYKLPTADQCTEILSAIPNSMVGSDHLCLGATFLLKKK